MSITRVSGPRRHFPRRYSGLDRFCPRPRLLISNERHRGDLARPMAALAVLLQNRKYVLRESNWRGLFGCDSGGRQHGKKQRGHDLASFPKNGCFDLSCARLYIQRFARALRLIKNLGGAKGFCFELIETDI